MEGDGKAVAPTAEMQAVGMMLNSIEQKFQMMSEAILGRMDEMADKINVLETSMNAMMEKTGVDPQEVEEGVKQLNISESDN